MQFREKALWAALLLGLVYFAAQPAHAIDFPYFQGEGAHYVAPAPSAPRHPLKVTLTGGASVCTTFTPIGQNLRVDCTVDCSYDMGTSAPDGGVVITAYPDAGALGAATADSNPLSAGTPETVAMTRTLDTVCVYSAAAGTAYIAGRY